MHNADLNHSNQTLEGKLNTIFDLRRTRSKVNWDRGQYLDLLKAFGNPHLSLPPVIHVAGTNGKGSIISMLRSILEEDGLSVHTYTSPHLININERIQLAGKPIEDAYLEELIDQALDYNEGAPLSFFEITTALAFRAFADTPADILLLEVGMGGELDCTNVINKPLCSIINRISLDHTDFLGDTIDKIAQAKAGIIKSGSPCVVGYQGDDDQASIIYKTINEKAQQEGVDISSPQHEWSILKHNDEMSFIYKGIERRVPLPNLTGLHQLWNAGVTLATLEQIKDNFPISQNAITTGLQSVHWPGRMQKLQGSDNAEIWLDCAHNDSAGKALAEQIKIWQQQDPRETHLVIGMLDSKQPANFLSPLLCDINALHIVPIPNDNNCLNALQISKQVPYDAQQHNHIDDALAHIEKLGSNPKRIIIAGSVYLAGYMLSQNFS